MAKAISAAALSLLFASTVMAEGVGVPQTTIAIEDQKSFMCNRLAENRVGSARSDFLSNCQGTPFEDVSKVNRCFFQRDAAKGDSLEAFKFHCKSLLLTFGLD